MNRQEIETNIQQIISKQINQRGYATVIDSLVMIGWLNESDKQRWLKGQITYLEKVCHCNLSKLAYFLKAYRNYAIDHDYKLSLTVYKYKNKSLRFSKHGRPEIEKQYASHIVDVVRLKKK